jgi:hypothetical protein
MPTPIDKHTIERLVALGRTRGGSITTDDLRHALPVDKMDADEIALVVRHLEEQGVDVDLQDASLLAPHPARRPVRMPAGDEAHRPATHASAPDPDRSATPLTWDSVSPRRSAPTVNYESDPLAQRAVMIAGLVVFASLALAIAVIA